MPLQIPAGFSLATLEHHIPGPFANVVAVTTLGMGVDPTPAAAQQVFEAWRDDVWVPLGTNAGNLKAARLRSETAEAEFVASVAGSKALELSPPNVSLLVAKRTNVAGRKNRGRFFPPGQTYDLTFSGAGQMTLADQLSYQAAYDALFAALNTIGTGPVILHQDLTPPTPITSFVVDRTAATQRRRLR